MMKRKDLVHGNASHGVNASTVRQRFDDLRTSHGQQLAVAMKSLTDHFGAENITAPMQIIIDANIRPKIITMVLISEWINRQEELVSPEGKLPNVLAKNYIAFSNALRRDLESLCAMAKDAGNKVKPPSITELIK
jgi:hypothetical protein